MADDPRINLEAKTEADYYKEQSAYAARLRIVGLVVAGIMALRAISAAMNTMYAAVSARSSEIGTLRASGFGPAAIMTSFLVESSLLAFVAGIIGVILALPVNGLSTKFNGVLSAPTLAFNLQITSGIVIQALAFAVIIGLAGGWLPARQAMRVSVVNALRRKLVMAVAATRTNHELETLRIKRPQEQPRRKRSRLVSIAILMLLTTALGAASYVIYAKTIGQSPTVQTMMVVARTDSQSSELLAGSGYIVTCPKC